MPSPFKQMCRALLTSSGSSMKPVRNSAASTLWFTTRASCHCRPLARMTSTCSIKSSPPTYGPYIASKAGVEGLVHVLANELRGRNVTVNAVAPGPVATELFLKGKSEEQIAALSKMPPLQRLAQPEDIARVVSFLAGPDGAWVNSQVLRANGGFAY